MYPTYIEREREKQTNQPTKKMSRLLNTWVGLFFVVCTGWISPNLMNASCGGGGG